VKKDFYNGINYAFMLNLRARGAPPADAVADFVLAQRIRRKVIAICEARIRTETSPEEQYWLFATLAEAWLGLGDWNQSAQALEQARARTKVQWMLGSTEEQLKRLEELLADSPLDRMGLGGMR
jgi:hypothetical protein